MMNFISRVLISVLLIGFSAALPKNEELIREQQRNGVPASICYNSLNGRFEKPDSCRQFYECLDGILYTLDCPKLTAFDPNTLKCKSAAGVPGCEGYQPKCSQNGDSSNSNPIAIPGGCDHYYQCFNGQLLTLKCQDGFAFNPKIGECDYEINVQGCAVPPCKDVNGDGISTAPFEKVGDCHNFYQCGGGILYEMSCLPPSVYNPELGACDWTYNVPDCYYSFT